MALNSPNWFGDGFKYADALRGETPAPNPTRDRLRGLYEDFVALGVTELNRVKSIEASVAVGDPSGKYAEALQLDNDRHTRRAELQGLSSKIKLYETNEDLMKKIDVIANSQPFMTFAFPPRFGEGNYNERFDKYQADVRAFDALLQDLIASENVPAEIKVPLLMMTKANPFAMQRRSIFLCLLEWRVNLLRLTIRTSRRKHGIDRTSWRRNEELDLCDQALQVGRHVGF